MLDLKVLHLLCACAEAIEQAVDARKWIALGTMVETKTGKSRPPAVYTSYETTVSLYERSYRAVVSHSSAHDKRRQKKIGKAVAWKRAGF